MLQAAILQQTAEYIYSLEQEKTRLLSQNCQLKRLVNQHEGGELPPKKRKTEIMLPTLSAESSDEGLGSMSPEPISIMQVCIVKTGQDGLLASVEIFLHSSLFYAFFTQFLTSSFMKYASTEINHFSLVFLDSSFLLPHLPTFPWYLCHLTVSSSRVSTNDFFGTFSTEQYLNVHKVS